MNAMMLQQDRREQGSLDNADDSSVTGGPDAQRDAARVRRIVKARR